MMLVLLGWFNRKQLSNLQYIKLSLFVFTFTLKKMHDYYYIIRDFFYLDIKQKTALKLIILINVYINITLFNINLYKMKILTNKVNKYHKHGKFKTLKYIRYEVLKYCTAKSNIYIYIQREREFDF